MKKLLLLVVIVLVVAFSAMFPHTWISPGELVQGHQKLNNQCASCHSPFQGIDNSKCIGCHKLSDIGKDDSSAILFHERLKNSTCTACHTEHKGVMQNRSLVVFDHKLLGESDKNSCNSCHKVPVSGTHKNYLSTCNSCHTTSTWKSTEGFNHAMILMDQQKNCTLCHSVPADNMHADFGSACISCHTVNQWKPSSFNHDKYFVFDGNHGAACTNCHMNNNFKAYSCTSCHEHSGNKLFSEHAEEGITDISNCVRCHRSGNEHDAKGGENDEEGGEHGDDD
jgi:hypothetical protein